MNVKLLRKVKEHILEEPKRFDMDFGLRRSAESPCGTSGCIAGWACVLNGNYSTDGSLPSFLGWYDIEKTARNALAITRDESDKLFHETHWPQRFLTAFRKARTKKGKARVAGEFIEHFIKTEGRE